jgi:hypothetical protein
MPANAIADNATRYGAAVASTGFSFEKVMEVDLANRVPPRRQSSRLVAPPCAGSRREVFRAASPLPRSLRSTRGLPDSRQQLAASLQEGIMKIRTLVGAVALVVVVGAGTLTARGAASRPSNQCCEEHALCCKVGGGTCCVTYDKQSAIINFMSTVLVNRTLVSGPVLVVHDDAKMARGEPCTTFYRFDPAEGPKEALVSFHCKPMTTVTTDLGVKRLVEYQIAGDSEAHGVPW